MASFSKAPASRKHCTWYLNSGNKLAEQVFHHEHLIGPYLAWLPWVSSKDIADSFEKSLNPQVEEMLSCVEQYHYLAAGCDGQRHRGPSEFAWFLSVAGCEPKVSTDIANHFWALNGVPYKTRLMIAQRGFALGMERSNLRERLQKIMVSDNSSKK